MKNALSVFAVAVGSALSAKMNTVLVAGGLDPYLALFAVVVAATAATAILKFILTDLPMYSHWSRALLDRRAQFEGYWIQHLPLADTPTTIGVIEFDEASHSYSFKGWAFDTGNKLFAYWNSKKLDFDLAKAEITYSFDAQLTRNNETVQGFGQIEFALGGRNRPKFGTGYFLDTGTNVRQVHYDLERLDTRAITEALSKGEPTCTPDLVKLVKHYSRQSS